MENRIVYSADDMRKSVEMALNRLEHLCYNDTYQFLGEDFTTALSTWIMNIRNQQKNPMTIVVAGDFKRGKSTFINALLGEDVVTTNVTTETVTLNRICYGEISKNEAILSGNRRLRIEDEELKRENLEKVLESCNEPVKVLELTRPCEFLKNVTIIDTPGLGDSLKDFSDLVAESIVQADVLIYIYSMQYPVSMSERLFLKTMILPQSYTKLIVLGNYADAMENIDTYNRMRNMVKERLQDILPEVEIITVSALDERMKQRGKRRPCEELMTVLEAEFEKLRNIVQEQITQKKDIVLVDRVQRMFFAMINDLQCRLKKMESDVAYGLSDVQHICETVEVNKDILFQKKEKDLQTVSNMITKRTEEAKTWMLHFLEKIKKETYNMKGVSTDDILVYYGTYCVDMMQSAMTKCMEYHYNELLEFLGEMSFDIAKKVGRVLPDDSTSYFRVYIDNKIWTKGDNLSMVASIGSTLLGGLGLLEIVTNAIGGTMRQQSIEKSKDEWKQKVAYQLENVGTTLNHTVENLYKSIEEKIHTVIQEYYADQMREVDKEIEQTVQIAKCSQEEKEKLLESVEFVKKALYDVCKLVGLHKECLD